MEKLHAGCAAIVDQLIRIREFEEKLVATFEGADQRCIASLRFRIAELNRWVDKLDRALDAYCQVSSPAPAERRSEGLAAAAHH